MSIKIDSINEAIIREHGEQAFPEECCGFMFGKIEEDNRTVTTIKKVENVQVENRARRFLIDPKEYSKAELYAAQNGLDFIGIYHSHPNHPAIASETDRKQAMPFFSYVIVSVKESQSDEIKSWRLNEDLQFDEEKVILN